MSVTGDPDKGSEGRTFTADEVQAILDGRLREHDAEWQGKLTQSQQAGSELRATIKSMVENRGQQGRTVDPSPSGPPSLGPDVQTAEQLFQAAVAEGERRSRVIAKEAARQTVEELGVPERLEAAEDASLEAEMAEVNRAYGNRLDAGQVRQVLQMAQDTGNGDLGYIAFRMFGPPPATTPAPGPDDADGRVPQKTTQAVLAGRARHQAAIETPKAVKVGRGMQGYSDVERIANKWAEDRGHS